MKKRMIAWLLCACMTFTAVPEMLLADVMTKGQQTQEDEKSAGTGQTETETDRLEEEDQNSEKLTEEKEEIENQEQTEITEETETTEAESTEETESAETELTEETEMIEESEVPEETEDVTEETESAGEILKRALSGDEISRIAWVEELITLFDLTVEEDNYPDNYYSDISADDSFYRDVMVACEYGMIDLAAGEEFRPEDAVTREFAAQTMNAMLGFVPETDSYTYQDTADVTYKEAAQVAIDRGWVTVSGDKFLPGQSLTTKEHDAMIADAKQVLSDAQIETGKDNTCTFASGVVIVPEGTAVSIDVEGTVMIENCPVTITQGTTFAVYVNDIAMAYKAKSVQKEGTTTYITTSDAEDGAVLNVDQQGELDVDLTEFVPADEETYVVNNVAVTESKTRGISYDGNTLRADKTISISDDVTATVNVVISNMKVNYRLKNNDYYFTVSGDMEYSCNVKGDAFKDINHTLTLGAVPLGGIGMLTLAMEYNLSGEATLTVEKEFEAGFAYSDGFRVVGNSRKKGFSFSAEADLTTGVVLSAKATLGIVSGDISAKAGARMNIKYVRYSSGTPAYCVSQAAYLYASVGASAKIGVGILSKTFSKSIEIWGKDNSPVRVYYHIEDGVLRTSCTRGKEFIAQGGWTSYWTSPGSRYFNPAGVGSYFDAGAGTGGAIVPIYTYTLDDANRATITGYNGSAAALYIPEEIDGHEVVAIGNGAFENRTDLKTVMIPDSVTRIDGKAFYGCSNLVSVTLSRNVESLGNSVFGNDDKLTEIEIPKSLKSCDIYYGDYGPFMDCDNLKIIKFEEGTTVIATMLFHHCTGIEEIKIPDTVTTIKDSAFEGCINLKSVQIPDNVTKIEPEAFQGCTELTNIIIPDSVTRIDNGAFYGCTNLASVTLSRNIESLGSSVFGNDDKLTEIEIPKSLKSCDIYYGDYGPFVDCDNLKTVKFEEGTTVIATMLFHHCTGIEEIKIPDTVTTIKDSAFEGCINLKSVQIPDNVTKIEPEAFQGCTELTNIIIPDSVTRVDNGAFYGCTNLASVTLSRNIESLGSSVFGNDDKLTEIEIPKSLKNCDIYYGDYGPFVDCDNLKTVKFEEGTTVIATMLFHHCTGIEEIKIPDTVTTIKDSAFEGCINLKSVQIPNNVTKIEPEVFYKCTSLTKINIPDKVSTIDNSVFSGCTNLIEVHLPNALKEIHPKKMTMYGPSGCYAQTYANGKGMKYVAQDIHATSISLDITTKTAERYDEFQLTATIAPQNFTDAVTWTSSNEDVATVSDTGYVEICGVGTAVITVTAGNVNASCTVNVPQLINWIEFDEDEIELKIGKTYQLKMDISPSDATNKKLEYTSSNTEVAEVSATGLVTAKSAGSAQIKASSTDGSGEYAICYVTVSGNSNNNTENNNNGDNTGGSNDSNGDNTGGSSNKDNTESGSNKDNTGSGSNKDNTGSGSNKNNNSSENEEKVKVKGITLNKTSATVNRGKKFTLKAAVSPSEAANKKVVFKSGNTKVATVDNSGKVTAKAPGKTKITVTSSEDSSYQASCTITVPYKITYKLNKGKNNASNPSTYYAKKITLKNPTRKGYAFAGWYKDAKFKKKIKTISSSARCDYTLYAKWTKVKVEKVSLTSAKNSKGKKIVLKSKKVSGAKGYEISYSTDKKFKKAVTKKNTTKTSYTISKLKKGKTYYVRIRAYKVDSTGKKVYGKYSSVKKVKISK